MKVKQQSFIGGMVGRSGQYSHKTENTFIEGVNMIPRRNGTLESRSDGRLINIPSLKHDKFLSFRFKGRNYYVVYDTLFKQKLYHEPAEGFIDKFNRTHTEYFQNIVQLFGQFSNSGTSSYVADPAERAEALTNRITEPPTILSEDRRVPYPLRCTDYRDVIRSGMAARLISGFESRNINPTGVGVSLSNNQELFRDRALAERFMRQYLGFGIDYNQTTLQSGNINYTPRLNFSPVRAFSTGIIGGQVPNGVGTGLEVFRQDPRTSTNWYCRFLIYGEDLRLISFTVKRPYFVEHDSEEPLVGSLDGLTRYDSVVDGKTRYAEEICRDLYGDTDYSYEAEVLDGNVIFKDPSGKLPPLLFIPPEGRDQQGRVEDLRCYYGLHGYRQTSFIPDKVLDPESGMEEQNSFINYQDRRTYLPTRYQAISEDDPSREYVANLPNVTLTQNMHELTSMDISDSATTEEIRELQTALNFVEMSGAAFSFKGADTGDTQTEIEHYTTSPYISKEKVDYFDLPSDHPLRLFLQDQREESEGETRSLCTNQVFSSEETAAGVTNDATFSTYTVSYTHLTLPTIYSV